MCQDLQQQVHCDEILQPQKKVPPDGNKLAGGVSAEPESLKANPASKWLNLAFVGARNQSRSLPHNPPQWKSIGSFRTRSLIKTGPFL